MLVVGSKYNALYIVSRFTKLFGKYSVKTQIANLYTKCIYITVDNQRHYAQEMKTIVKWVNKENMKFLRTEDTLHVQACENKCTKTLVSQFQQKHL